MTAIDYQFLEAFLDKVLGADASMRWAAVVSDNGVILSSRQRPGLVLLLTHEENEEYAVSAISRYKTRTKFESKIGKLRYAFGRYEGLSRATIPIDLQHYLLVTLDKEERDFDSIITEKIFPLIASHASRFAQFKKNAGAEYESGTFRCAVCAREFLTKEDADSHSQEHKKEAVSASE
jgi:hypothetical protein